MSAKDWLRETKNGCAVLLHVQPNAKSTEIIGLHGEPPRLKIKVHAPPVDGKANDEIVRFFAELFGIPKNRVSMERGVTGKQKEIVVEGLKPADIRSKIIL